MKNLKSKIIFITMIIMMFGVVLNSSKIAMATNSSQGSESSTQDEFSELLSEYESEAPEIESAELSSVFTSEKEIEVYLKTNRSDIKKVVISGWSGGVYENYLTSKEATYDEMRNIYTVTFSFDEIVNTETNKVESKEVAEYYFDACVYANNGSMSYANLDKVQYTESGIITTTRTNTETNETEIEVTAVEDGYVAVLNAGEEATENLAWQKVTAGETVTMAVPANNTTNSTTNSTNTEATTVSEALSQENTQQVRVLYKAGTEVTGEDINNGNVTESGIMLLSTGTDETTIAVADTSNMFKDSEKITFEISQNSGKNDWISYDDTPNVLETTIQGLANTTATATIKIKTEYPVIVTFDYMISSEEEFDIFEINGTNTGTFSGQNDWQKFSKKFEPDDNGYVTVTLTYSKDKNIDRYDDKAAIRNLLVTSVMPTNGQVVINDGATITNNATLNLSISVDGASEMLITENTNVPSLTDVRWEAFSETKAYTLQNTEDGLKTVYVWFKNEIDALSETAAQASIKVDTIAPTNTAPEIEKATSTTVTVNLKQTDANELMSVKYGYRVNGSTDEYTWTENIRINNTIDTTIYTISGLTEITEYEIATKVSDGASDEVTSESTIVKTKIPSDNISITKSPANKTLDNVTVTINWNDTTYTHEYSLDNDSTWTTETNATTTIELTENQTIYYRMKNENFDTGDLEYVVDNIDREGPKVEKIEVVSPETGVYGIDDVITIELTWNEEVTVVELPKLNINFGDGIAIPLTATENTATTITYKYTITEADGGYLGLYSLEGGLLKDSLNNESLSVLPELTGSTIFVENAAYIASKNKYYGTIQNAVNAAKTEATTIKVVANTELRDTLVVQEGQNITIDLNGKTISIENEEAIVSAIENAGTLTIIDNSTEQTGKIIATSQNKSAYTIINNPTGKLNIKAGKVEAVSNSSFVSIDSYAIYNKGAGTVTLGVNDDTVSIEKPELIATAKMGYGLYIANAEGNINFYDGIIKGTEKAISMSQSMATYNMPAGYIEKEEIKNENGTRYQVAYLSNESAVEMYMNGITTGYKSILEAVAKVPKDGRLAQIKMLSNETLTDIIKIYAGQNIEIDLNGYTLTRNESTDGAVYAVMNNGTLKILDSSTEQTGRIEAIAQKDVNTYAVYNYTNGNLTIDSGTLFASINVSSRGEYTHAYGLGFNNTSYKGTITINGGEIYREDTFLIATKVTIATNKYLNQRYETIDGIKYKVNYVSENPVVQMTNSGTDYYYTSVQQAVNAAPTTGTQVSIKMLQSEELTSYLSIASGKNIELDLNGKEIIAENIGRAIYNYANLIIKDSSKEKAGTIQSTDDSSVVYGIYNTNSGNVELNEIKIIVVSYDEDAHGIYNNSTGNVVINGGEITVSLTTGYSAKHLYGISNISTGSIEINGVTINAITAEDYSYGLYNESTGNITMHAGRINTSAYLYEYGIYVKDIGATVYLTGGEWTNDMYIPAGMSINNTGSIDAGKVNLPINKFINYRVEGEDIVNFIDDIEGCVAELTVGETTKGYLSIQDAVYNAPTDGTLARIKLLQNEYLWKYFEIKSSQNVELDLNGKELNGEIRNNGELIVKDNLTVQEGRILGGIQNLGIGNVIFNSGIIKTNTSGIINSSTGNIIMNGGTITSQNYVSNMITGIKNSSTGSIIMNGGNIELSATSTAYGISNESSGNVTINDGKIVILSENYLKCIYNKNGNIYINGGNITGGSKEDYSYVDNVNGIYNNSGIIEITGGNISVSSDGASCGIYDYAKGTIKIGKNDGVIEKESISILGEKYALYVKAKGGIVSVYDGILKATDTVIYPTTTTFQNKGEVASTSYVINIPDGTQVYSGTEGTLKTKYLEFKEDYVPSEDEITDLESPYVSNIEVITPETGDYAYGSVITLKSNWNENINTTSDSAPKLKISFGNGTERTTTVKEIGSNYITYEYVIDKDDDGELKFVSYLNGNVTDSSNNTWQETNIMLTGYKITAKTRAYISSQNKYYCTLQEAIDNCELNATDYTTIQLLKDNSFYGECLTIQETQKVEIDLNGCMIDIKFIENGIVNYGDLKFIDTSEYQTGRIVISASEYGIKNEGVGKIELSVRKIDIFYSKGIYNGNIGTVIINECTVDINSNFINTYGIYNFTTGKIIINNTIINVLSNYGLGISVYGIYNENDGSITLNGGIIKAYDAGGAYGIYINNNEGEISITDGECKGTIAGIYIPEGMTINNSGNIEKGKVNIPQNKHIGYKIEEENISNTERSYIVNYLEDIDGYVAELTVDNQVSHHLSIQDAIYTYENVANGSFGKIKMLQNENIGRPIEIKVGQNIEIDLNGKEILSLDDMVINNKGKLKILDTSEQKNGEIKNLNRDYHVVAKAIQLSGEGILMMESGTVSAQYFNNGRYSVYSITNTGSGNIIINGGAIKASTVHDDMFAIGIKNEGSGNIIINDGLILAIGTGGEVDTHGISMSSGNLTINGGTIEVENDSSLFDAYGLYWNSTGNLEINGGNITSLKNNSGGYPNSYGIYINNIVSKVHISAGEWKGTIAGIYIPEGMPINNNGSIENGKVNVPQNKHIGYRIENEYIINYLEDTNEYVVELTVGNQISKYLSIQDAIYNVPDDGILAKIKMLQNENLGRQIEIKSGQNIEIDLNGKEIIACTKIALNNNGNIKIIDSSSEKNGVLYMASDATGSIAINNKGIGTVEINEGTIKSNEYGICNVSTGIIIMNAGNVWGDSRGITFSNSSSLFYFNDGKVISDSTSIYPTNKTVEVPPNSYVKKYIEKIDGIEYQIAEIDGINNIKLLNSGNVTYYDNLSAAVTAAPTDGTLSQIQLLTDTQITADITIASGKNIQLDLNGKTITYKSYSKDIKAFINNGTFEIIDSGENGKLEVEAKGYDAYGIYNGSSSSYKTATFKLIDGTINITSYDEDDYTTEVAYGIYNYYGTNTEEGNEAIRIEGGSINVIAKSYETGITTEKAYGIYNDSQGKGTIVVTGGNTSIIANSELNESYGIYNSTYSSNLIIGEKDNIVSMTSPRIEGGTSGIYKGNSGAFNFYDGAITGLSTKSVNGTISNIEDDSKVYVIDNQDGTETTILYRDVRTMEVTPEVAFLGEVKKKEDVNIVYTLPDASDATITYEVEDDTVAGVRMENNQYVVYPKAVGRTMVTFTVTDVAGNSVSDSMTVVVDNIPPTNNAPSATSTSTSVTITCNQTDVEGVDANTIKYAISSDNGATWSDWTNRNIIAGLTPNTEYLIKTKASDMSGNETESETTIIKTKLPNNSTFALNPSSSTKENVLVTIIWNNPEQTPQYYKVGATGEWTLATDQITEITVTDNTIVYTKLVYNETEDSEIKSVVVDNIDRLTPTGTIEINEDSVRYDGGVTLKITATDDAVTAGDNAGAVAYMYLTEETLTNASEIPEDGWIRYEGDYLDYEYFLKNEGTTKVNMWLKDKVGNISEMISSEQISNDPPVATLIEDGVVKGEYTTINAAYNAARASTTSPSIIVVGKTHTMTAQLKIASTKNIVLDLNGQTVTSSSRTQPIYNQGILEITDSKGNGVFENTYSTTSSYGVYNYTGGTLKVTGGTIKCTRGRGIYNYNSSSKIIIGNNDGTISTTSPVIIGATYGIYSSSGTVEFYDGMVQGASGQSIYCTDSYLTKPANAIISKTTENSIETAILAFTDDKAPTLKVDHTTITVTANQTGINITNTYYAISENGTTYGEWQESNVFSNLTEGQTYYVKTKIVDDNGETESKPSIATIGTFVASLTENGEVTYYESVQQAISAASSSNSAEQSVVTMLKDETRDAQINISSGNNILLDLNGKTLTIENSTFAALNGIYNDQGKLEIKDSMTTGKIVTSLTAEGLYDAYGIYNYKGTLTINNNVTLEVVRPETYKTNAYGIYDVSGITTLGNNDGDISLETPKITSTGYGLYKTGDGTFNFYDGIVTAAIGKSAVATSVWYTTPEEHTITTEANGIYNEIAYVKKIDLSKILITEWTIPVDADVVASTTGIPATTIKLPIPKHENNNYTVDWGEGKVEMFDSTADFPTHTYTNTVETTYTIKVTGTVNSFGYVSSWQAPTGTNGSSNYYTFTQYLTGLKSWGELNTKQYGFSYCINLGGEIPVATENSFKEVTYMGCLFKGCSNLTGSIPEDLFKYAINVTSFDNTFNGCKGLTGSIPENLFTNTTKVTSFGSTFASCSGLTEIPEKLFANTPEVTAFGSLFYMCSGLTCSIPAELFANTPKVTSFASTFYGCSNLTGSIPENLFVNTTKVTSFSQTFQGCRGLTGNIPKNLFVNTTEVTNISSVFHSCYSLTGSIPESLFSKTTKVTSFSGVFTGDYKLTGEIPEKLFANTPEVTDFSGTFHDCYGLSGSIPKNLFANTPKITNFFMTFRNCKNLTGEIPANLFKYTTKVTNFGNTFENCSKLTGNLPANLFKYTTEVTSFNRVFAGTGITGMVPAELFKNTIKATNYSGAFASCSITAGEIDIITTEDMVLNNMFSDCKNLQSLVLGEKFKHITNTEMFKNCSSLRAIILLNNPQDTSSAPIIGDATTLKLPDQTIFYVPIAESELAYEQAWAAQGYTADRIEQVIKAIEPNPDYVGLGEVYDDPGYTVAGFPSDGEESNNWKQYGFFVEIDGDPVDTSTVGSKWMKYRLRR